MKLLAIIFTFCASAICSAHDLPHTHSHTQKIDHEETKKILENYKAPSDLSFFDNPLPESDVKAYEKITKQFNTDITGSAVDCCQEGTLCALSKKGNKCSDLTRYADIGEDNHNALAPVASLLIAQNTTPAQFSESRISGDSDYCENCLTTSSSELEDSRKELLTDLKREVATDLSHSILKNQVIAKRLFDNYRSEIIAYAKKVYEGRTEYSIQNDGLNYPGLTKKFLEGSKNRQGDIEEYIEEVMTCKGVTLETTARILAQTKKSECSEAESNISAIGNLHGDEHTDVDKVKSVVSLDTPKILSFLSKDREQKVTKLKQICSKVKKQKTTSYYNFLNDLLPESLRVDLDVVDKQAAAKLNASKFTFGKLEGDIAREIAFSPDFLCAAIKDQNFISTKNIEGAIATFSENYNKKNKNLKNGYEKFKALLILSEKSCGKPLEDSIALISCNKSNIKDIIKNFGALKSYSKPSRDASIAAVVNLCIDPDGLLEEPQSTGHANTAEYKALKKEYHVVADDAGIRAVSNGLDIVIDNSGNFSSQSNGNFNGFIWGASTLGQDSNKSIGTKLFETSKQNLSSDTTPIVSSADVDRLATQKENSELYSENNFANNNYIPDPIPPTQVNSAFQKPENQDLVNRFNQIAGDVSANSSGDVDAVQAVRSALSTDEIEFPKEAGINPLETDRLKQEIADLRSDLNKRSDGESAEARYDRKLAELENKHSKEIQEIKTAIKTNVRAQGPGVANQANLGLGNGGSVSRSPASSVISTNSSNSLEKIDGVDRITAVSTLNNSGKSIIGEDALKIIIERSDGSFNFQRDKDKLVIQNGGENYLSDDISNVEVLNNEIVSITYGGNKFLFSDLGEESKKAIIEHVKVTKPDLLIIAKAKDGKERLKAEIAAIKNEGRKLSPKESRRFSEFLAAYDEVIP